MDFFEKAHVVKRELRKEHKSDETVKKQLKQILTGFKKNDNKLIKNCEDAFDPTKLMDESSSVSGYSDLNLTNSSNEDDTTRATIGSDSEDLMNSDVEEPSSHSDALSSSKDKNTSESLDLSKESISEYDDNIQSLSDSISAKIHLESDSNDDIISLNSSLDGTITSESTESEFDADRVLANKILEKLKDKRVVKKKGKKRKADSMIDNIADCSDKQKYMDPVLVEDDNISLSSSQSSNNITNTVKALGKNTESDSNSSDFVSIVPTDMLVQQLSDVLGDYKHPTVKNITENQNLQSTNNSGTFSIDAIANESYEEDDNAYSVMELTDPDATDLDVSQKPESESTNIYDDTLESEDTSEKEMSVEPIYTDLECPIKVYYGKNNCIFLLKNQSELYIHGKVIVTALQGTIEMFGYTLGTEPCEVYAPNYNYAYCLKSIPEKSESDVSTLILKLTQQGLSKADADEIVTELDQCDGVVSLHRLENYKLDFVESNISTDLFSKTNKNVENCFKKASEILSCSLYLTRPYKVFEELSCWRQVLKLGLENQSRGIICGGKGVGKTTFLRYYVNRMLARGPVLVVDLDPGQAEFTVAGNISATIVDRPLLGPNFTHLKTPNIMLNIGMINTMDNPRRYAAAVATLISQCNNDEQLKALPWVVNTMGMCNAMGLKFITQAILNTKPSYLLQINSKNPKKGFNTHLTPENIKDIYQDFHYDSIFRNCTHVQDLDYSFIVENHLDSSPKKNSALPPRDERYLNFLAYFSKLLSSRQTKGLLGVTPYEVNLGDLRIGLNVKIGNDAVAKVINGKIIALCQLTTVDNAGKVFTLKDKPLLCHGYGLIRGIDLEKEILYVITPTPVEKLSLVDSLVYADWVPELRGQEKHLPNGISVPYRTASMYQKRQLMFTPRRRFNPLQLMKMSRNT